VVGLPAGQRALDGERERTQVEPVGRGRSYAPVARYWPGDVEENVEVVRESFLAVAA